MHATWLNKVSDHLSTPQCHLDGTLSEEKASERRHVEGEFQGHIEETLYEEEASERRHVEGDFRGHLDETL